MLTFPLCLARGEILADLLASAQLTALGLLPASIDFAARIGLPFLLALQKPETFADDLIHGAEVTVGYLRRTKSSRMPGDALQQRLSRGTMKGDKRQELTNGFQLLPVLAEVRIGFSSYIVCVI